MGEAGLTESGGTVKKDVVDRFAPPLGRGNGYLEIFLRFILPDKVGQAARTKTILEGFIFLGWFTGYNAWYKESPPSKNPSLTLPFSRGEDEGIYKLFYITTLSFPLNKGGLRGILFFVVGFVVGVFGRVVS
jgi:hypothetical protein